MCKSDVRSNIVDHYGDAEAMIALEDVLQQSRLTGSLLLYVRCCVRIRRVSRLTRNPDSSVTGKALGGLLGVFFTFALTAFVKRPILSA